MISLILAVYISQMLFVPVSLLVVCEQQCGKYCVHSDKNCIYSIENSIEKGHFISTDVDINELFNRCSFFDTLGIFGTYAKNSLDVQRCEDTLVRFKSSLCLFFWCHTTFSHF